MKKLFLFIFAFVMILPSWSFAEEDEVTQYGKCRVTIIPEYGEKILIYGSHVSREGCYNAAYRNSVIYEAKKMISVFILDKQY